MGGYLSGEDMFDLFVDLDKKNAKFLLAPEKFRAFAQFCYFYNNW